MRPLLAIALLLAAACGAGNLTPPGEAPGPQPLTCLPDLDGRLEAAELPVMIGLPLSFDVAGPGPVDLAGRVDAGVRLWDWSAAPAGAPVALEAASIRGRWYEAAFPGADAVLAAGPLEAVYRKDDEALWLLGMASAEPEPETLLVYEAPVALYRFPLEAGASWTSVGEVVGGLVAGLPYHGRDVYEVAVHAQGQLRLPDATFTQVHAVRTRVQSEAELAAPVVVHQTSFLFECFGEIARATGPRGDDDPEFTQAAEVRRLILEAR